jgi:hypothetical protein
MDKYADLDVIRGIRDGNQYVVQYGNRFGMITVKDEEIVIEMYTRDPNVHAGFAFWFCQCLVLSDENIQSAICILVSKIGSPSGGLHSNLRQASDIAKELDWRGLARAI